MNRIVSGNRHPALFFSCQTDFSEHFLCSYKLLLLNEFSLQTFSTLQRSSDADPPHVRVFAGVGPESRHMAGCVPSPSLPSFPPQQQDGAAQFLKPWHE